jgi:hypothetical protein
MPYNFNSCVIEGDYVYCVGNDGKIYQFNMPKEVSPLKCSACVITELLRLQYANKED